MAACDASKLELEESSELGSAEMVDTPCSPCAHQGLEVSADHYCIDCDGYVCNTCVQEHKESKFSAMRAHKIKPKEDCVAGQHGAGLEPASERQDRRCGQHPGNVIDMFCETDEVACCGSCAILNHKECKSVVYIPYVAVNIKKSMEFSNLQHVLNKTLEDMKLLQQNRQADKCRIAEEREGLLVAKNALRQQLEKLIDDMDKTTEQELERKHNKIQEGIDKDISEVNESIESLEVALGEITSNESKSEVSLFIHMKNGKKKVTDARKQFSKLSGAIGKEGLNFKFYKILSESFKLFGIFSEDGDSPTPLAALANCRKCMNEAQFCDSLEYIQKGRLLKTATRTFDQYGAKSNIQSALKAECGLNGTDTDKKGTSLGPSLLFAKPENVKPSLKCRDAEKLTTSDLNKGCSEISLDGVQAVGKKKLPEGSISLPSSSDRTDNSVTTENVKRDSSFDMSLAPPLANNNKSAASVHRSGSISLPTFSDKTDKSVTTKNVKRDTNFNPSLAPPVANNDKSAVSEHRSGSSSLPTFSNKTDKPVTTEKVKRDNSYNLSLPPPAANNDKSTAFEHRGGSIPLPTRSDKTDKSVSTENVKRDNSRQFNASLAPLVASNDKCRSGAVTAAKSDNPPTNDSVDSARTTKLNLSEKEHTDRSDNTGIPLTFAQATETVKPIFAISRNSFDSLSTTEREKSKMGISFAAPTNRSSINKSLRAMIRYNKSLTSIGSSVGWTPPSSSGIAFKTDSVANSDSLKLGFSFDANPTIHHGKTDKERNPQTYVSTFTMPNNSLQTSRSENPKMVFSFAAQSTKSDKRKSRTDTKSGDLPSGRTPASSSGMVYKTDSVTNHDSLKLRYPFDVNPTTKLHKTGKETNPKTCMSTVALSSNSLSTTKYENPKTGFPFAASNIKTDIENSQTDKKSRDLSLGLTQVCSSLKTDLAAYFDSLIHQHPPNKETHPNTDNRVVNQ